VVFGCLPVGGPLIFSDDVGEIWEDTFSTPNIACWWKDRV